MVRPGMTKEGMTMAANERVLRVVIPDDYQDCVRTLKCFALLAAHDVKIYNDTVTSLDALVERFKDADVLVLIRERTKITKALLERLPNLKLICQTGKVSNHIDMQACVAHGVPVMESSGSGAATAELTWALVLASRRYLVGEVVRLKSGAWQGYLGQQLYGQRLGIWGYGRIGQQVARYGQAFGMKVFVWGRAASVAAAQRDEVEVASSLEHLLLESDVLSLHVRLNADTRGMIGAEHLAQMKTSRAELVREHALENALKRGRPGFAAVDVFEEEPVLGASHPLIALHNALCTPHIGYVESDNYESYFGMCFEQIKAYAASTGDF
jgi:D-3-phosphoglycerate dehydrogenase / 2-oxoglutarate reductase